jgi:hypothetical protein
VRPWWFSVSFLLFIEAAPKQVRAILYIYHGQVGKRQLLWRLFCRILPFFRGLKTVPWGCGKKAIHKKCVFFHMDKIFFCGAAFRVFAIGGRHQLNKKTRSRNERFTSRAAPF